MSGFCADFLFPKKCFPEVIIMTEKLLELLKEKNYVKIKSAVRDLYPADLAALLETLEPRDITLIFRLLPKELAAETFTYMDSDRCV